MAPRWDWARLLGRGLLTAGLAAGGGCLSFVHPIPAVSEYQTACCRASPTCCRDHVYVFLIHGMDPLDCANLKGVRDYVLALGFRKTYYGQLYHTGKFAKEMRRIREENPSARFVLIGFSLGANMVRGMANSARDEGIPINLVVYLGGNTLGNDDRDQPENVGRVVNILASGSDLNGTSMDRALNVREHDVFHFGSPSHPYTLDVLARELAVVASDVPVVVPEGEAVPEKGERGEWDFLKPVSRLGVGPGRRTGPEREVP